MTTLYEGEDYQPQYIIPTVNNGGGFSKIDASWEIFEQHVKTLFRKLTLGCQWVFNMDSRLYCITKVDVKRNKHNKVSVLEWPSHTPDT